MKNTGGGGSAAEALEARARQICAAGRITQAGSGQFRVPSQSKRTKRYDVNLAGGGRCTCIYFFKGNAQCRHIIAAGMYRDRKAAGGANDRGGGAAAVAAEGKCRLNCKCGRAGFTGAADGAKKCGCVCRCRKDPRAYDFVAMVGRTDLLRMILGVIDMAGGAPYEPGVGFGGRRGHDPRAMTAIAIMRTFLKTGSRNMVGVLGENPVLLELPGVDPGRIPRKTAICDAYGRIPPEYLRKINCMLVAEAGRGSLAVDSTGKSTNTFEQWSSIEKQDGPRKGYLKLHAEADIKSRMIVDFEVTPSSVSDIREFRVFLNRLGGEGRNVRGKGDAICADSAYLARDVCSKVEELGYVPIIMPRSNTVTDGDKDGSTWQRMISFAHGRYEEFKRRYGQRSIIECMFGALKRAYGNGLSMRRPDSRRIEMGLEVLCYNSERICRLRFSECGSIHPGPEDCPDRRKAARPLFYPPGSAQRAVALQAAALFDKTAAATA